MNRRRNSSSATVVLTERALADLREIERYSVKEWGQKAADRYLDGIAAALDRLGATPEILRRDPDIAPGLFFYRVKKHHLVCNLQEGTVTVLAVIHTSMDLPARLQELEPRLIDEVELLQRKWRNRRGRD